MALLFMDSFDHYATADLEEKWTTRMPAVNSNDTPCIIGAYGRNSTQGLHVYMGAGMGTYTGEGMRITVNPATATCIVGFAVKVNNLGVDVGTTVGLYNASSNFLVRIRNGNDALCMLRVNTDGTLEAMRDGATYTSLGISTAAIQAGVWAYIEAKFLINSTTGTVDVRLNGTSILSLTGVNTRGNGSVDGWNNVDLGFVGSPSAQIIFDYDDFVLMDTGGSLNNAFLGDVTVSAIYPSAGGNTTGWTPSAGSNYDCCNEALVNDDTDYVSTAVLTTKDTYNFTDAPAGADIKAVQLCIAARKGTEGPGQLTPVVRSSSTDYDKTAQGIGGTSYSYLRTVIETDPATAAAWTESGFNGAEFGFKKTA